MSDMFDKEVRTIWVAISTGWVAAFTVWAAGWLVECDHLGQLAILIAAGVATLTVREFFIEHDESVRNIITVLRLGETDQDERTRLRPMR